MANNDSNIELLREEDYPELLREISDPPKKLYIRGTYPKEQFYLAVVGSRRPTPYGRQATETLIRGLSGFPIVIISGLALGVDTLAHQSALEANLKTVAVPGSGLSEEVLYPSTNHALAEKIIKNGGALLSEFDPHFKATPWSFPQRNRIMAGLSHAVLLIEAEMKSGTLITARLAGDYNRDVLALPGSIFSSNSKGTNFFLRLGATPITSSEDILAHFNLKNEKAETNTDDLSEDEKTLWDLLSEPLERNDLLAESKLSAERATIALSLLELKGIIRETMGMITRVQ